MLWAIHYLGLRQSQFKLFSKKVIFFLACVAKITKKCVALWVLTDFENQQNVNLFVNLRLLNILNLRMGLIALKT